MAVTSYSLGAAQEVTGSKHILEVDGRSFMIDCGALQGKRAESDQKNRDFDFAADKIESVILTHAHYDHCGLLPVLAKNGYGGNIYATPATRDLANIVMMDSARIQARDAEFLGKQAKKKGVGENIPQRFFCPQMKSLQSFCESQREYFILGASSI